MWDTRKKISSFLLSNSRREFHERATKGRASTRKYDVGRDETRGFGRTIVLCMLRAWISIARAGRWKIDDSRDRKTGAASFSQEQEKAVPLAAVTQLERCGYPCVSRPCICCEASTRPEVSSRCPSPLPFSPTSFEKELIPTRPSTASRERESRTGSSLMIGRKTDERKNRRDRFYENRWRWSTVLERIFLSFVTRGWWWNLIRGESKWIFPGYPVLNLNLIRDEDFVESFEGWIKNTPLPFDTEPLIFPLIRNQNRGGCSWRGGFFDKSLSLVASLMDLHLYNPSRRGRRGAAGEARSVERKPERSARPWILPPRNPPSQGWKERSPLNQRNVEWGKKKQRYKMQKIAQRSITK